MAKLSNSKYRRGPATGHNFDRIKEKLYGNGRYTVNYRKELFSSDYIYKSEDDDVDGIGSPADGETGINKNRHRFHDADWCNSEKDEHYKMNRYIDNLPEDDGDLEDIMDMLNIEENGEYYG